MYLDWLPGNMYTGGEENLNSLALEVAAENTSVCVEDTCGCDVWICTVCGEEILVTVGGEFNVL